MQLARLAAFVTLAIAGVQALGPLGGVNLAGFDFSVATDGSFNGTGVAPPASQAPHFASQGANLFRIPFAWQLATPTLGGSLDSSFLSKYDAVVNNALNTGAYVIIDLHNYARWNGGVINQGGPTNAQFASVWSQLASHYASQSKIIFGVMNEPHDLPNNSLWPPAVQAAVNAIRSAGATSQYILIPGSTWASAQTLPTELGPALLNVTDPSGGTSKLLFDVHKYLDSDNSGTHTNCVTDNTAVLATLDSWLGQNGRQAILSETGGGRSDSSCYSLLGNELAFVASHPTTFAGFSLWAAGSFAVNYTLSLTPDSSGNDAPLWTNAIEPNLPGKFSGSTTTTPTATPTTTITYSTSTTKPTTSTKPTTTSSAGGGGCSAAKYAQCGGIGYSGCTTCASGSTCTVSNPYYSQCL